jgi:hypothetical protein
VDTHAQNSVFGQIDVFVVEHLLLRVGVDVFDQFPDGFRQKDTHEYFRSSESAGNDLVGGQFFIN